MYVYIKNEKNLFLLSKATKNRTVITKKPIVAIIFLKIELRTTNKPRKVTGYNVRKGIENIRH